MWEVELYCSRYVERKRVLSCTCELRFAARLAVTWVQSVPDDGVPRPSYPFEKRLMDSTERGGDDEVSLTE